ncbi:MAG: TrkH family potassium uptake protein [Ruminococcaceae bacterium]|nr:TrkH family potassium uptake protein [Oscillospiraceae bacterium]
MNLKMIFYTLGRIIGIEAILMLLPLGVSMIYGEWNTALAFLLTAAGALIISAALYCLTRNRNKTIYAREGFVIVALAWLSLSAIGAVPFVLSGDIPSYVDAFFETVSGFTTTGASILRNVEILTRGAAFWRSFSHFIGGMGVLVLMMAIIPDEDGRSIHIMRAEMPGPVVDKIVPRVKNTAKILYLIYIAMTLVEIAMLCFGGMSLFESAIHSFGTAGTGGFGIMADSIGGYSPYCQWVITVFMLLFGVNFNLYYLLLIKRFCSAVKSEELWAYVGIVAASVAAIVVNLGNMYSTFAETLRHSAFQVASIITTTGYSTVDFDMWPGFSKAILLMLMFVGGCAGSTAGGLKVSRVVLLFKSIKCEVRQMLHPRAVTTVKFEGKPLDEAVRSGVGTYFALYALLFGLIFLIVSFEPFDLETSFSATAACFNNVGPGFAAVGPIQSYADYSGFTKLVLSFAMLLGRLELYPLLLTLIPSTWARKKK